MLNNTFLEHLDSTGQQQQPLCRPDQGDTPAWAAEGESGVLRHPPQGQRCQSVTELIQIFEELEPFFTWVDEARKRNKLQLMYDEVTQSGGDHLQHRDSRRVML